MVGESQKALDKECSRIGETKVEREVRSKMRYDEARAQS